MWKVSKCGVFSGPYFPVFELPTEIYKINPRLQSKYGKIRTRKELRIWILFTQCQGLEQTMKMLNLKVLINNLCKVTSAKDNRLLKPKIS